MTHLNVDRQAALHGAETSCQRAAGERDELVRRGFERCARTGDVVHEEAGGQVVASHSARRGRVDLSESIAHGIFTEGGHAVVVQVEGSDAGTGDDERAHVGTARVVHACVSCRESGEVGQRSGNSGQQPRGCFFYVAVRYIESSKRGEARHYAVHARHEVGG